MDDKKIEIKKVAHQLFLRHGYSKVSMSDIADDLSISRPTLYKSFSSKESIFNGIALDHIQINKEATVVRLKNKKEVKDKIQCLFDIWIIEPFASVVDSENGKDLLENGATYAPEAIGQIYSEFEHQLTLVLKEYVKSTHSNHLPKLKPKDLAHILVLAVKGLKASTETLQELKRMTDGLILMAISTLQA